MNVIIYYTYYLSFIDWEISHLMLKSVFLMQSKKSQLEVVLWRK